MKNGNFFFLRKQPRLFLPLLCQASPLFLRVILSAGGKEQEEPLDCEQINVIFRLFSRQWVV